MSYNSMAYKCRLTGTVEDAAEAVTLALERYNESEPVNLGAGFEISIRDLVNLIVEMTGYRGRIVWDSSQPDGRPRRMLDTSRAKEKMGFTAKTDFRTGLTKTIDWYERIFWGQISLFLGTDFKSVPKNTTDFKSVPKNTTDFKSVPINPRQSRSD